ncbi:MAG: ABC transporter ATP-binding protein [Bacteroidales bacterium]|nr:ABC transporter ATP-binding protein [Bacteroidales bacterium]
MEKKKKQSAILLLLQVAKPGKVRLSFSAILIFAGSLCSVAPFYIAFIIIEKIIDESFLYKDLISLGIWAAVAIVLQMVFSGVAMTQSHVAAYKILFQLRVKLANKMTRLPLGFYESTSSGYLKKVMMGDIEATEEFIAHNLVDLLSVIFIPILIFTWLATIHLPLALICIFPVFAGFILQRIRMRIEAKTVQQFFKLKGQMNTTIIEFIKGMPVIKAFNQSVFSFKKYKDEAEAYSKHWIDMNKKAGGFFAAYALMMDIAIILMLPIGGLLFLKETLSLSSFLIFMFLGLGLTRYMKQLVSFGSNITQIGKGVEALNSIMDAEEMPNKGEIDQLENYDIEFKNVSFGYGEKLILKSIDFKSKQGTITALTGNSGAGKTTVGRLIPRFWDIKIGEIKIGGVNIKEIHNSFLMRQVSFVFQDVFLFNDTLLENIRMGDNSISRDDVINISQKAQCHEFIMNLPDGYDTYIGAGGTFLSGGERQRISIARAIAKNSPIIILDEATSYADTENETKIQKALSVLLKNKTVLIIAHRLSTIKNANQILVFRNGEIIERGTHEQLCAQGENYKTMWDMHIDAAEWGIKRM